MPAINIAVDVRADAYTCDTTASLLEQIKFNYRMVIYVDSNEWIPKTKNATRFASRNHIGFHTTGPMVIPAYAGRSVLP